MVIDIKAFGEALSKGSPKKSYKRGVTISRRVKLFDPSKYSILHSTSTHDQYNCPYCIEIRGKADNDAKFYYSREKHIGYCFKCHAVGVLDDGRDYSEIELDYLMGKLFEKNTNANHTFEFKRVDYESMLDPLDDEGKEYLINRFPLYELLFDYLQFRVSPSYGVSVPIWFRDEIISYNIRLYNPENHMKYYIPKGVKYLYSPNRVFNKGVYDGGEITLVEGIFDAIGALVDGKPNPIAILGSTITPMQIYMLRTISPSKINIFLDETKLSYALKRKILNSSLPTLSKVNIIPAKYDPEERLKFRLKCSTEEEIVKLIESTMKLTEK